MDKRLQSFADLYLSILEQGENSTFLNHREDGEWKSYSKTKFLTTVRYLSLAFEAEGWRSKQIAIAISPSTHWLLIDYALMLCGAVSVPLFTNISSKNLRFQIADADLHTVFVESVEQTELILGADPGINCIAMGTDVAGQTSLDSFVEKGQWIDQDSPERFANSLTRIDPDDLVTIVYTSGTSGLPKGVELTHYNLISQVIDTAVKYSFFQGRDTALSLLPLAHIFERMVMHFYLSTGMSIYFADDVKNIKSLMQSVQPTVMTVVPRLLEKVSFKMYKKAMGASLAKRVVAMLAFYRARRKDPMSPETWLDRILARLVYSKLRAVFGGKIRMLISGGAPLADDLARFFCNIGLPLYQGYGLTEASPVICANAPGENRIGSCGRHFAHTEARIDSNGELLGRGPGIMRGYHNNSTATDEVIDADGWLHTGDLATMDAEGYITITGRIKELSKTSTGKYISTSYIEHLLLSCGWFDQVMSVGNSRPFVVALLMIDEVALSAYATKYGFQNAKEAALSRKFHRKIRRRIRRINKKLNHWERIRDFHIITEQLSIENGDLTPSMKLARDHVQTRFHSAIEEMYKGHI